MNHKKRRRRHSAACICGGKVDKANGVSALRGGASRAGRASVMRLAERAREAA